MIAVKIDPNKKRRVVDPTTLTPVYEHMKWCSENCRSRWYNQCEDYSFICIEDQREALNFALEFSSFKDDQEKMWFMLRWS